MSSSSKRRPSPARLRPRRASVLVRPLVRQLAPYVPGEQPRVSGLVKLNTNENPYPPSPKVRAAVRAATDARLRLYPNPSARALREALASLHGCRVANVVVGNGSDELLALATRAFVEPAPVSSVASGSGGGRGRGTTSAGSPAVATASLIQYFRPSYTLYPVLASIHGAVANPVALRPDFGLPTPAQLRREGRWNFRAALTFITTPNAPTGRGYGPDELEELCRAQQGVVVLDETYVDFAERDALALALRHPNVLVSRTFSKAYCLCFLRVGYFLGNPELIEAIDKIRDSYNVNGLGQIAALATLEDLDYYQRNFQRILRTREHTRRALEQLGFEVAPSQTNFLFVRPPRFPAPDWLEALRQRRILVRWFPAPETRDYLRISIGTETDMTALLDAVRLILRRVHRAG